MESQENTHALVAHCFGLFNGNSWRLQPFSSASENWLSFIQAFAGGAILMMLANSMMPEAYEHGGKLSGVFTVLGFAISVLVVVLENA